MREQLKTVLFVLVCAVLASCSSVEPTRAPDVDAALSRDADASFQTDSLHYLLRAGTMGYEAEIFYTYTNLSPATAYFMNCGGFTQVALEKLEKNSWIAAWSRAGPACLSQPIVVQPYDTYRGSVRIFGGYPGCNCMPRFAVDDPTGVYRIVWGTLYNSYRSDTQAYSSLMPFEMRVSNRFTLTAQPR